MADSNYEWVEMIEPRSRERMFANLTTGECVWHAPPGVRIKAMHSNQWWELFDKQTNCFYYYNAASQQTVWHRPANADIIPLAKLQELKDSCVMSDDGEQRSTVRDEGTQTLTKDFSKRSSGRWVKPSVASPQMSRKQRDGNHRGVRADVALDVSVGTPPLTASSAAATEFRVSPLLHSPTNLYGYVHRGEPVSAPQRSLESPPVGTGRTCDILLDLERSSRYPNVDTGVLQRGPDLMSKSCYGQLHSTEWGDEVLRSSGRGRELQRRVDPYNPYGDMSSILAVQATPRPKPRVFPRTNPTYVGIHRNDGFSTYRRIDDVYGLHQRPYDGSYGEQGVYGLGLSPASKADYSTLRQHRPTTSQSFDVDSSVVPSLVDLRMSDVLYRQHCDGISGSQSSGSARRLSEPFYVNIPFGGLKGGLQNEELFDDRFHDGDNGGMKSLGVGSIPELGFSLDSVMKCDKDSDCLSEHSTGSVFVMAPMTSTKPHRQFTPAGQPTPDLLHQFVIGQKLADTESGRSDSPVSVEKSRSLPVERAVPPVEIQRPLSSNMAPSQPVTFGTPGLQRRYKADEVPVKYYSESDGDVYNQDRASNLSGMEMIPERRGELHSLSEFDLEEFLSHNLNEHRKGLLGRHVSVESLLTWTKDVIKKPIIRTESKMVKKEAPEVFKRIQMYMGDRPAGSGKVVLSPLELAVDVVGRGWTTVELRDEIYIQLCRQTTRNPLQESLQRGLELLCICLMFFPPSPSFMPYLQLHLMCPVDSTVIQCRPIVDCLKQCRRRLEHVVLMGPKVGLNQPSMEDVDNAMKSIYALTMFGCTLPEVMALQQDRFPKRRLPWIQTMLSEEILRLNGVQTEGIFRVPGDTDAVTTLKSQCDRWVDPLNCTDPCVPASLLKYWYRELYEPLIPFEFYDECINNHDDVDGAVDIVARLPALNRDVLKYLIRFLQVFAAPENVILTKMDVNNLSMVMAPNCLRNRHTSPQLLLENTRREMGFVRTLIESLDTTDMVGVI